MPKKTDRQKQIERALREFPKVVKQNERRGKSYRKLMKAFDPVTKELAKQIKKRKLSA